ncbi:hypothetical protein VC83_03495 [Pseudogymnoascus destructans]|uniref:Uncharacterized protein n=2 Tax=Pseudogymnoascus destructans TaxID=655981 RepID=L8FTC3_PSED2|nr:uncharacterized protein VC83_03495 [Pseudogymnoascus destructans]ELR02971.1 hypothetical protein GMDG_05828 [Pseudogymnoascus destructans 20631-21]OAF60550.1 hypothetical protein VC83_03495 [Pseudogymnoascus destructans]
MATVGQNEGTIASNVVEILRRAISNVPPSPSLSPSGQQAMAWPSDTTREESSSPPADPQYISIRTLWPHSPDLPPGPPSTSQDRLLHALGDTHVENIYGLTGLEGIQPSTLNALNSPSVVHTTGHETFLSSTAGQQALPLQFDYERNLAIAKFREDHQGAITFDDDDDEEFFLCLGPPSGRRRYSPTPILATSPAFEPWGMYPPFYDWDEDFDSDPPVSKELDPAAPVFEYQPSHAYIQDTASGADQQALRSQDSVSEPPEPDLPAEASGAAAPGARQQAVQSQDAVSESPESELPTQALSAPAPQPHAPQRWSLPPLRDLPFYSDKKRKGEEAELRAQRMRQQNRVGAANGNGTARSQQSQNGNAASGPSSAPYMPARSNGFMATATPSRGSSRSGRSMALGSHNGSSIFPRARNGSFKPRNNPPSLIRSGPSKGPQTGSNSSGTTATTYAGLSTHPAPSSSPPCKFEDTALPSNSVERPATPGPSGEPRTNPATKGKARTHTKAASPPRPPPAPTTGTAGVPVAATRPRGGRARGRTRRQSPPAQAAGVSTSTGQNLTAAPRSPTGMPTRTRASNGTADAGPSTEGSSVPVEPTRISDQESALPTRQPMPRPTQTNTGNGVADAGPSAGGRSTQVCRTRSNLGHEIFEAQIEYHKRFQAMGGYRRRGG